jgi:hypothetical protein
MMMMMKWGANRIADQRENFQSGGAELWSNERPRMETLA